MACGGLGFGELTDGFGFAGAGEATDVWLRWCRVADDGAEEWGFVAPEPVDVPAPDDVWFVDAMPNEAPTALRRPSEARPVWSRLLRWRGVMSPRWDGFLC